MFFISQNQFEGKMLLGEIITYTNNFNYEENNFSSNIGNGHFRRLFE